MNRKTKNQVRLLEPYFSTAEIADRLNLSAQEVLEARLQPGVTPQFELLFPALQMAKRAAAQSRAAERAADKRKKRRALLAIPAVSLQGKTPLEVLVMRVDSLELSVYTLNVAGNAGLEWVYQLVVLSESQFLKKRNSSRKAMNEIKDILDLVGLRFGMLPDDPLIVEAQLQAHLRAHGLS